MMNSKYVVEDEVVEKTTFIEEVMKKVPTAIKPQARKMKIDR